MTHFIKPNPLPKYFGIDVDGTFYTTKEDVYKRNIEAFKLLKDKNIIPFFCTARRHDSVKKLMGEQFFRDSCSNGFPGIYTNGSLVYDSQGNIIKFEKIPKLIVDKFVDYADKKNINNWVIYSNGEDLYTVDKINKDLKKYYPEIAEETIYKIKNNELKCMNVVTIISINHDIKDFELIDQVNYIVYKKKLRFQITPKNCNKKAGLEALLSHLNSKPEECAYIGDNTNDNEALEFCSTSFAVGDADDDTKKKAKWVLDINHDEGAFEKAVKLLCE